jgi:small-conductance mechanosensitive channel
MAETGYFQPAGCGDGCVERREVRHFSNVTAARYVSDGLRVGIFIVMFILYAHLIAPPQKLGTALLAGVGVASIVFGMAAQSTLSNLVAGLSLLLYHPVRVGDRIQLMTPKGLEIATVESLTLGYTVLTGADRARIFVPNSVMAGLVIIRLPPNPER